MELVTEILLLALYCNGLTYAASEGYALHWFYKAMSKTPDFIFKPVIGCIYCMASYWGFVMHTWYCIAYDKPLIYLLVGYPIVMISGVFVNGLVKDIIDRINRT